jgi:uncharacterized metal-binding protein YceD (DUF177 family)
MALLINIRQVEKSALHLQGELTSADLEWDTRDEMIRVSQPLAYDLRAERLDRGILVQGRLRQVLDCECVRCLKTFTQEILMPDWNCLLTLDGDDKALVVNDCVDLTPYLRDDIFLAFPQHPLCSPRCNGLANVQRAGASGGGEPKAGSPVWEQLNKLKL